jgi:hypothetical protein
MVMADSPTPMARGTRGSGETIARMGRGSATGVEESWSTREGSSMEHSLEWGTCTT